MADLSVAQVTDSRPYYELAESVADPVKREELLRALREADRYHEQALLEDMGYDNCDVCQANRRREAWGQ